MSGSGLRFSDQPLYQMTGVKSASRVDLGGGGGWGYTPGLPQHAELVTTKILST